MSLRFRFLNDATFYSIPIICPQKNGSFIAQSLYSLSDYEHLRILLIHLWIHGAKLHALHILGTQQKYYLLNEINLLLIGSSFPTDGWWSGQRSGNHSAAASGSTGEGPDYPHQTAWAGDSESGRSRSSSFPCSRASLICLGNLYVSGARSVISRNR